MTSLITKQTTICLLMMISSSWFLLGASQEVLVEPTSELLTAEFGASGEPIGTWEDPLVESSGDAEDYAEPDPSDNSSLAIKAESYLAFRVGYIIQRFWMPISAPIGFVGNSLSLAIMLKRHNRRVSCCVYMIALAISDNLMLFSGSYLWVIAEIAPRGWYIHECKFICYVIGTFGFVGVYLILFMTADRAIAVRFPFKATSWCTTKRARITCVTIIAISMVYEIPHYIYAGVIDKKGRQCAPFTISNSYVTAYTFVNLMLNAFLPFICIFSMNGIIIKTVLGRESKMVMDKDDAKTGKDGKKEARKRAQAKQLVIMLLMISFALMIFTLPLYLRWVIWRFVDQRGSPAHFATYVLFFNLSNQMFYTNNAINFFLYCAGGSRFRADLYNVLSCGIYKPPGHAISTASTSRGSAVHSTAKYKE